MPFPSAALSAANLVKLRGDATTNPTWYGGQYLSLCPNTVIMACRVNGAPTGASYAQFNFDTVTTGAYSSCRQDMTILVSHTNDQRAAFVVLRARAVPTSTIIYCNETSAPIADNDYVWFLDDYRLWDKLPREVSGVQKKDYDVAYRGLLPVICGLQTAYAGWCNSSDVLRLTLDASTSYAAHSGATISTYSWTVPSGTSYIVGNASASSITIDVPASAGNWIHLAVTDSGSRVRILHLFVHPANDTYPPALGFTGAQISGGWDGWNATVEAFSSVSSVLDNTFAVVWSQEYYNGTEGSIVSTVDFVGRFRQEATKTATDETYSSVQSVGYQLEGPAAQLSRVEMRSLALRFAASPSVWDEINNLTLWRAICHVWEHSTAGNLHSLTFDSTANTFLAQQLGVPQGDVLHAMNDLADSINAFVEWTPQGEARVVRDLRYESATNRNAAVTYANWTTQDYTNGLTINADPALTVGKVPASGAFYNTSTDVVTPLLAIAPGVAQDIGVDEPTLTRQILTANATQAAAQAELNTRTGNRLEIERGANTIQVDHLDGYHLLIPSRYTWFTWTIAATDNARGLVYTTSNRWLLQVIQIAHDNASGTRQVSATYIAETTGTDGQTVDYPAAGETSAYLPDLPPFGPYDFLFPELPSIYLGDSATDLDLPAGTDPTVLPKDGNAVLAWDSTNQQLVVTTNFLLTANPTWKDKTPSDLGSYLIKQAMFEPGTTGAYLLASDGTNSAVWYTTDVLAGTPDWSKGADTSGLYNVLRHAGGSNILIYSPSGPSGSAATFSPDPVVDPTSAPGNDTGLSVVSGDTIQITANGYWSYCSLSPGSCGPWGPDGDGSHAWGDAPMPAEWIATLIGKVDGGSYFAIRTGTTVTADSTGTLRLYFNDRSGQYADNFQNSPPVTAYITVNGTATAIYSSDNGATWGTPHGLGTGTPGLLGGFDAQGMGGTVSLGAYDQAVGKATTLGGTYSAEANGAVTGAEPITIIIPWYQLGSDTSANTGSTPDYLLGASALVTGEALWKVTNGGGKAAITPSVGGVKALAVSANGLTIWKGKRIAYLGSISGATHLFTTVDTGANWTDRGAQSGATFLILRRRASFAGQYYWNISGGSIKYTPDGGATIKTKTTPLSSVNGVDIYG